jgi:hypothetical protein
LHFDGEEWTNVFVDIGDGGVAFKQVVALSEQDVFVFPGSITHDFIHFDGTEWQGICGGDESVVPRSSHRYSETEILVASYDSLRIVSKDSCGSSRIMWGYGPILPEVGVVPGGGMWVSNDQEVYVGTTDNRLMHFDGGGWAQIQIPGTSKDHGCFNSVWGSASGDVCVVHDSSNYYIDEEGEGYASVFCNFGNDWHKIFPPPGGSGQQVYSPVSEIWGLSKDSLFVMLRNAVLYFNGEEWGKMELKDLFGPMGIWGTSDENVFLVGMNGGIWHCTPD